MLSLLWQFFKTGPDIAQIADSEVVKRKFNSVRWRVFASITIGYAFYYIIRQSYSVIKKPLLASGIVTPTEIGIIGSIFFVTYGLGKFTNSFLADRMNNKRFFSFGLFISSLTMVGMGLVNSFVPLAVLWGLNGWFQSYGAGPSIVAMVYKGDRDYLSRAQAMCEKQYPHWKAVQLRCDEVGATVKRI